MRRARFRARWVLALALLGEAGWSQATLAVSEPSVLWRDVRSQAGEAIDLVFLPDGFQADEQGAFETSVRKALEQAEQHPASFLRADRDAWNVHVAFLPSREACPASPGDPAERTAFATRVASREEGGLFESDDARIAAAAREVSPSVDCVIVIVRAERPIHFATGDLPGEGARIRLPEGLESVLLHELGHSLFALGDEYVGRGGELPEHERSVVAFYPNVTVDPSGARFALLAGKPVELEEGALDFASGVFRAKGPCVMSDASAERFCDPCAAVIRAGRRAGEPAGAPRLGVEALGRPGEIGARIEPAVPPASILRSFALLVALKSPAEDGELLERFERAHARVSRKTRYMESEWLGDGSAPGEAVHSLEGHVDTFSLGKVARGSYALLAASVDARGASTVAIVRFEVPLPKVDGRGR